MTRRRIRFPRSLRTQLTTAAALLTLAVVAVAGFVIAARIHADDLTRLDDDLAAQSAKVSTDAAKLLTDPREQAKNGDNGADSGLLAGSQTIVRVLSEGRVVTQHGDTPPASIPLPTRTGYTTVALGDQRWRSLVATIPGRTDGRVQVLDNLAPVEQRLHDNQKLIAVVAAVATVLAAVAAWLVAGLVLAPLQRLRGGADRIRSGHDLHHRLPPVTRPQEVAELSDTLNTMLDGLRTSMTSVRRFTADAGHELRTPLTSLGIDLETLRRNPDLSPERRVSTLDAMATEHARIVELFEGLQALARGDTGALPETTDVELTELVDDALQHARRRHPDVAFALDPAARHATVTGWPTGLRTAIDNLLDNAARHGKPAGTVEVTVTRPDQRTAVLTVADDGPGIPADQRERMKERFTRGPDVHAPGSGLGLALVDQQATLHGGRLDLADSVQGGLQASITVPVSPGLYVPGDGRRD